MNGILLDLLLVLCIVVFGIRGAFKGFFKMLLSFLGIAFAGLFYILFFDEVNYFFESTLGLYSFLKTSFNIEISGVSKIVLNAIFIFVILRLLGALLAFVLNKLFSIRLLKPLNRLGGFLLGAIKPVLLVIIICISITRINIGGIFNEQIDEFLQESVIVSKIYQFSQENLENTQI